jgi:hypothetical protein
MTSVIGLILLFVFLAFALAMFLERLSALLALPLMAVTFVLVAAAADLAQPAQIEDTVAVTSTDAFGRQTRTVRPARVASRFEQWKQLRLAQARLLHDKSALLAQALDDLGAVLSSADSTGENAVKDTLARIYADEQRFRQEAERTLDAFPIFFARPPHHGGERAPFDDALNAIVITENLRPIATALDRQPPAQALPIIRPLLERARRDSARFAARYAALPDPAASGFRLASAGSYLLQHLILVLRAGSLQLSAAIIASVFGGMFAVYVKNLKVAERLVYWTAEFAGERPFLISLAVLLVTAGIFTSVGGLGTVIMLGTIILPVLRSVGLSPVVSAGVFLIGIATGGTLQPVSRRLWMDFYGISAGQLDAILWTLVGLYLACGLLWIWWGTRQRLLSSFHAVPAESSRPDDASVPARLMVAPLIPVALVYLAGIEEITAFTVSLVYAYLCVCRRPGATRNLARSLIEGAQTVMPPVLLMVGIGLLVVSLSTAPVQAYLRPLLAWVVPHTRTGYIVLFALAAPLALYRGPLNVWGMGLAVSATLLATSSLPPAAVLCAVLAAGMLQGVCDPTNTANVWVAGFAGVTVNQILRRTLLLIWATAAVAVVIFGFWFVGAS